MGAGIRVQEPGVYQMLWDHEQRLKNHDLRGDERWIYVGTAGIDGVDDLLTADSPPFQNGWTNALGVYPPVSFRRTLNGWVHFRGAFVGGADGSIVFTLPQGFWPEHREPFTIPTASVDHYATYYVEPTGEVVFGTVV